MWVPPLSAHKELQSQPDHFCAAQGCIRQFPESWPVRQKEPQTFSLKVWSWGALLGRAGLVSPPHLLRKVCTLRDPRWTSGWRTCGPAGSWSPSGSQGVWQMPVSPLSSCSPPPPRVVSLGKAHPKNTAHLKSRKAPSCHIIVSFEPKLSCPLDV